MWILLTSGVHIPGWQIYILPLLARRVIQWSCLKNICGDQDDFYLSFDDDALSSDIPCPPTDSMTYIPDEPLSLFVGSNALGTWRMKIFDDTNQDGGALEGWTLRLCGPPINMLPPSISITSDTIESGATLSFSNDLISGDCTGGVSGPMFTIVSLPQYGILYLDGVVVEIGTSFNQSDIDKWTIHLCA